MSTAARVRIAVIGVSACIAVSGCMFSFAAAQTTCPNAGDHPATASDIPTMILDGITNPQIGQCWNPSNFGGAAAAQAKQYLQSASCNSRIDIQDLNPGFAVCAQKFIQSAKLQDPKICITSAYRSAALQLTTCMGICGASSCPGTCAAPGNSFHQFGLAIDVKTTIPLQTLWQLATQQGLLNPTGLHSSDPYHIQAPSKSTPVCNSGNLGTTVTPGQGLISTVANATGLPLSACTAQNYCAGNAIMSQNTSCAVTQLQACPYGCINGTCMAQQTTAAAPAASPAAAPETATAAPATTAATVSTPAATVTGTTQTGGTVTGSTGASSGGSTIQTPTLLADTGTTSLDLIDELANEGSSGSVSQAAATTTPIVLNQSDSDIAELQANSPFNVTAGETGNANGTTITSGNDGTSGSTANGQGGSGIPGVSYAQPTSALLNTAGGSGNSSTGYATPGNGYTIGAPSDEASSTDAGSAIAQAELPQSGVSTFVGGADGTQPQTAGTAPANSDTFGVLSILDSLKAEVQGALTFLSIYAQPFQGNIPSQNVGE